MTSGILGSTVKQHLACLRRLFDWRVPPTNPAHSVRATPSTKDPVLSSEEARALLEGMEVATVTPSVPPASPTT